MKNGDKKIRVLIAKVLIFVMVFNFVPVGNIGELSTLYAAVTQGNGTAESPYIITTAEQLNNIRNNLTAVYTIENDIDMFGQDFKPIGTSIDKFTGTIDGKGHVIKNLNIQSKEDNVGFISVNEGTLKNIGFYNGNIKGKDHVGIVGSNEGPGNIENVYSALNIEGQNAVGGISGSNYGLIKNVYTNSNVFGNNNVAGICGSNSQDIENTYAVGNIRGIQTYGGIIGINNSSSNVKNSYSNIKPIGNNSEEIVNVEMKTLEELKNKETFKGFDFVNTWDVEEGTYPKLKNVLHALVNDTENYNGGDGTLNNPYKIASAQHLQNVSKHLNACYIFTNDIDLKSGFTPLGSESNYFTGILDGNNKVIKNLKLVKPGENNLALIAYNDGYIKDLGVIFANIEGENNLAGLVAYNNHGILERVFVTGNIKGNTDIAGLVAKNEAGKIINSYSRANVTGEVNVGSLVGHNRNYGVIDKTYAVANVDGKKDSGSLVGTNENVITNSYTLEGKDSVGNLIKSAEVTSKTDAELKEQNTYKGWDFSNTWKIDPNINDGYPHFVGNPNVKVSGITVTPKTLALEVNGTSNLTAKVTPKEARQKDVIWSSTAENIAKVDNTGKVTAIAKGEAIITATTVDGNVTDTCKVIVGEFVEEFKILDESNNELTEINLTSNNSKAVKITPVPEDAEITNITCSTSVNDIFGVEINKEQNKLTVKGKDILDTTKTNDSETLTINVTNINGGVSTKYITINVKQVMKGITLTSEGKTVDVDIRSTEKYPLNLTINPINAEDKFLKWSIDNTDVADFETNPTNKTNVNIVPKKPGKVVVTVETNDPNIEKITKKVTINFYKYPKTLTVLNNRETIENDTIYLCEQNKEANLTHVFDSQDVTDNEVIWEVDNTDNITFSSETGKITVKEKEGSVVDGTSKITVTTTSSKYTELTKIITVKTSQHATAISLNKNEHVRKVTTGEVKNEIFVNSFTPANVANKKIKWTSSNENVATVGADPEDSTKAVITYKGLDGETDITAEVDETLHQGAKATCKVIVQKLVTSIEINPSENLVIHTQDTEKTIINANVLPVDAGDQKIIWTVEATNEAGEKVNIGDIHDQEVSENGSFISITPKQKGKLKITATSNENPNYAKSLEIEIRKRPVSVSLDITKVKLTTEAFGDYKKTQKITGSVNSDSSAVYKNVGYRSLDENVATVDANGNITAVNQGQVDIEVYSKDFEQVKATCKVTVRQAPTGIVLLDKDGKNEITDIDVYHNQNYPLKYKLLPENIKIYEEFANVEFTSENEEEIKVDATGIIEVLPGARNNLNITAKTVNGKTAKVTVVPKHHPVSISLDKQTHTTKTSEEFTLTATVKEDYAENKNVNWTSSDESKATVENGVVKAIAAGTVTITATLEDNFNNVTPATCVVTIKQSATSIDIVDKEGNIITEPLDVFSDSNTLELSTKVEPTGAVDTTASWESSNESIATVENGVVTFVDDSAGEVDITVKTTNNKTDTITLNVKNHASGVSVTPSELLNMFKGDTVVLEAQAIPDNSVNTRVIFRSENPEVATVDENSGIVKAIRSGNTNIIVTTVDGEYEISVPVKVTTIASELILSDTDITKYVGDAKEVITYRVNPEDTTNKKVNVENKNENIVSVENIEAESKLKINPLNPGEAEIVVSSISNPSLKQTIKVHVKKHTETISISENTLSLENGETFTLTAVVGPEDATNKNVVWESEDESIATVVNGKVTALKGGVVKIFVRPEENFKNLEAICTLTVKQTADSINIFNKDTNLEITEELNMDNTQSLQLEAIVLPTNTVDKTVTWSSSDTEIATVDGNGKVSFTGTKKGKVTITAHSANNKTDTINLNVTIRAKEVTVEETEKRIDKGDTYQIVAKVLPDIADNKGIEYISENPDVASVDANGLVTGNLGGETEITVKSKDGNFTKKVKITVIARAETLEVSPKNISKYVGEEEYITYTVGPEDTTIKDITLDGYNTNIIKVTKVTDMDKYKVEFINPGNTTINVISNSNNSLIETINVEVRKHVESISLNKNTLELETEKFETLVATVNPEDATNKKVIWDSTDKNVAVVDQNGKVTAKNIKGTTKITATTEDGSNVATCIVTVIKKPEGISLTEDSLSVLKGESISVTATVLPEGEVSNPNVVYEVIEGNKNIEVAQNGNTFNIKGKKVGSAKIRVKTKADLTKYQDILVVVKPILLENIDIIDKVTKKTITNKVILYGNESKELEAKFTPETAEYKTVTWSVDKGELVDIAQNGKVTAKENVTGTCIVKVTSNSDLNVYDKIQVEVRVRPTGIQITPQEVEIFSDETYDLEAVVTPANAYNKNVKWEIVTANGSEYATVDKDTGLVTPTGKAGVIKVKATTLEGNKEATVTIKIKNKVTDLDVQENLTIKLSEEFKELTTNVIPQDAENKEVIYEIDKANIATLEVVDLNTVKVKPVKSGLATIIVKSKENENIFKTVNVRVVDDNANLKSLSVNKGNLNPAFNKDITEYEVNLGNIIEPIEVNIECILDSERSVFKPGYGPRKVKVLPRENKAVKICVVAEDGTEKTYTVNLKALDLRSDANELNSVTSNPQFTWIKEEATFSVEVPYSVKTIKPILTDISEKATISPKIVEWNLNVGLNTKEVVVTSEKGTAKTFKLNVTRRQNDEVNLQDLKVDGVTVQGFNGDVTEYTVNVPYAKNSVVVTAVAPEEGSYEIISGNINNLAVGTNIIVIKSKAQNNTSKSYTLKIVRKGSSKENGNVKPDGDKDKLEEKIDIDNELMDIAIEEGTLYPEFKSNITEYVLEIPNNLNSLKVTGVARTEGTKIEVIGADNLKPGENNIIVKVSTKDGQTKEYKIKVVRDNSKSNLSKDNYILDLEVKNGVMEPEFKPNINEYLVKVLGETEKLDIKVITNDDRAKVKIIGNEKLVDGENIVIIEITAENGSTRLYNLKVIKESKSYCCCIVIILLILLLIILLIKKKEDEIREEERKKEEEKKKKITRKKNISKTKKTK